MLNFPHQVRCDLDDKRSSLFDGFITFLKLLSPAKAERTIFLIAEYPSRANIWKWAKRISARVPCARCSPSYLSMRLWSALKSSDRHSYCRPLSQEPCSTESKRDNIKVNEWWATSCATRGLPGDFNSSGETKSVRSGSSPYQNIHNSLAAVSESGGWMTEVTPTWLMSNMPIPPVWSSSFLCCDTRRHTQRISLAKHFV